VKNESEALWRRKVFPKLYTVYPVYSKVTVIHSSFDTHYDSQ